MKICCKDFLDDGIANELFGSEDNMLTSEMSQLHLARGAALPTRRHEGFRCALARWMSWRLGAMDWAGCRDEVSVRNAWVCDMCWKLCDGGREMFGEA